MLTEIIIVLCFVVTAATLVIGFIKISEIMQIGKEDEKLEKYIGPVTTIRLDGTRTEDRSDCCVLTVTNNTGSDVSVDLDGRLYVLEAGASYEGYQCLGYHRVKAGRTFRKNMSKAGFYLRQDDTVSIEEEKGKIVFR